jgi:putative aldouronate transport system substrate-binding protein
MKKQTLLCIIASLTASALLAGCGSKEKETTGVKEKSSGPLAMSITLNPGSPQTENTPIEQELNKALNTKLELIPLGGWNDFSTKLNLLMSDKATMPDILWRCGMDKEYQQWIENGQLVDMLPLLQKYGKNLLNYYDVQELFYGYQDGKIYGIPGDISEPSCRILYVRQDWLDKLGLKAPATLEEFVKVCKAFTLNDPDGNGKDDTFGLAAWSGSLLNETAYVFQQAYGVKYNNWIIQEDGTVKLGSTMPEMKEALRHMQEMFKNKYIDKGSNSKEQAEVLANGKYGFYYGYIDNNNPGSNAAVSFKTANPTGKLVPIELPKGPTGFSADWPESKGGWCFNSITTHAKDTESVFEVLDKLNSPEIFKLRKFGVEGTHYKIENGQFTLLTDPNKTAAEGLAIIMWAGDRKDEANIKNTPDTNALFEKRAETAKPLSDKTFWPKTTERAAWTQYGADLDTLRDQAFSQIILGEKSVDYFDDFVKEWYSKGGTEVEKEMNQVYKTEKAQFDEWTKVYEEKLAPNK